MSPNPTRVLPKGAPQPYPGAPQGTEVLPPKVRVLPNSRGCSLTPFLCPLRCTPTPHGWSPNYGRSPTPSRCSLTPLCDPKTPSRCHQAWGAPQPHTRNVQNHLGGQSHPQNRCPPRGGEDAAHPCRAGGAPAGCGCPGRRRCRCAASRPRAPSPAPRRAPWPAAASACTCASCTGWGGSPCAPQNPSTSPSPAPETFKAYHLKAT